MVPVRVVVLVPDADGVSDLVEHGSPVSTSVRQTQVLLEAQHAHIRPAAAVVYAEVTAVKEYNLVDGRIVFVNFLEFQTRGSLPFVYSRSDDSFVFFREQPIRVVGVIHSSVCPEIHSFASC